MRKFSAVSIAVVFISMAAFSGASFAQEKAAADPAAARKAAEERGKLTLGSKEWNIEAKSTDPGSKAKPWSDVLNLADGKLSSKHLGDKGFANSNIAVTVDGGMIIWETMQRGSKGEIAFWRGELSGNVMNGVVSLKPEKGETEEFAFTSAAPPAPKEEPVKAAETDKKKAEPVKKGKR